MKALVRMLLVTFLALPAVGCIDVNYDFSKLDTTVTVLKGAEFPVPNVQILLKDVFQLDDSSYITCDGNGNYLIDYTLTPLPLLFVFPESDQDRIPIEFEPLQFPFGSVPDFLSGNDQTVIVDLSDMQVGLQLQSDIPAEFSVNLAIEAIRSGEVSTRCTIDDLKVRSGSTQYVFVQEKASSDPDHYRAVPELGKLFSPIPEALSFRIKDVYANAEQRAQIAHDKWYYLTCQLSAKSPIRFAEGTCFTLSTPLDASLNLDEIGLKKAVLSLDVENSIPLDFSFALSPYDEAGNRMESIQVKPDFEKISALGKTKGSIELTTEGDLRFSSLQLALTASAPASPDPSAYYGLNLNRNQGLKLTGMSLYLPDGIQVKLDPSSENK